MAFTRLLRLSVSIGVLLIIFNPINTSAQSGVRLQVESANSDNFPDVSAFVSATDPQGFPINGLSAENFSLFEDGVPIESFGVEFARNTDQALAFVLAIDTSGSMGGTAPTPLDNAVEAAIDFVDGLAPQDQVALLTFSDSVQVVQDLTDDKALIVSALNRIEDGGNTALYDSIVEAVDLLKGRSERRVLVLLTDGEESGVSEYALSVALDETARWAIPIYPIGFGAVDREELEQMAALTGGSAQIQPDSTSLASAFETIAEILQEQYLFRFTSTLVADAAEHELKVVLDYQAWHAESAFSFFARPRSIEISLPDYQPGQVIGGKIKFEPSILAPGEIERLDVLIDGEPLDVVLNEPFELAWDASTTAEGSHAFEFLVEDSAGNRGSFAIDFEIQPPIRITPLSPQPEDEQARTMNISADITFLASIAKVDFFIDGEVLDTLQTQSTDDVYSTEWNLLDAGFGEHEIVIRATDVLGNVVEENVDFNVTYQEFSLGILIVAIGLALALMIIPIGIRRRRQVQTATSQTVLHELEGMEPNHKWPVAGKELRLGRKRDINDIHLKGRNASRSHAIIVSQEGGYILRVLNPANPVIVNGQTVTSSHTLAAGDELRLGESVFRFEDRAE